MDNPKNENSISRYVKLEDYKVFDYEIPEIFLDFVIEKNFVNVTTKLKLVPPVPFFICKGNIIFSQRVWKHKFFFIPINIYKCPWL